MQRMQMMMRAAMRMRAATLTECCLNAHAILIEMSRTALAGPNS